MHARVHEGFIFWMGRGSRRGFGVTAVGRRPCVKPGLVLYGDIRQLTRSKDCGQGAIDGGFCVSRPGNIKFS